MMLSFVVLLLLALFRIVPRGGKTSDQDFQRLVTSSVICGNGIPRSISEGTVPDLTTDGSDRTGWGGQNHENGGKWSNGVME